MRCTNDRSKPPNDIFHASSFMQGHNAEYLEQLYARYATDPNAVDEAWQEFFRQLGDSEVDVKRRGRRAVLGAQRLAADADRTILPAALTGEWPAPPAEAKGAADKIKAKAAEKGVEVSERDARSSAPCWIRSAP